MTSSAEAVPPEAVAAGQVGDDDDFFGGHNSECTMQERELKAAQQRLAIDGYREAHATSKEQALQGAFDSGYAAGARLGWDTGLAYGALAAASWALGEEAAHLKADTDAIAAAAVAPCLGDAEAAKRTVDAATAKVAQVLPGLQLR